MGEEPIYLFADYFFPDVCETGEPRGRQMAVLEAFGKYCKENS